MSSTSGFRTFFREHIDVIGHRLWHVHGPAVEVHGMTLTIIPFLVDIGIGVTFNEGCAIGTPDRILL